MPKPKVLLADDHTIVLDGLRSLLEDEFELVGSVEDGRALVEAATANVPDVIVVDISMPLLNGIEAVRQLRAAGNEAKVIFLTMHGDVTFVREALRAGGSGYLLKRSAAKELVTAIQQVLRGKIYVTPLVTDDLPDMLPGPIRDVEQIGTELTDRQKEVLQLVAEGHSIKEIAGILNVSVKTVEFHKYRIMESLGIHSTAELTKYAIKHGLVSI